MSTDDVTSGSADQTEAEAPKQQKQSMTFNVPELTGESLVAHYIALNGSNPSTMNNKLFLWQVTADEIPVGHAPNAQVGITESDPESSQLFDGLSIGSEAYLVGYAVGPCSATGNHYENVAATVYVPRDASAEQDTKPIVTDLTITFFGDGIVALHYDLPHGAQPTENLDWIGVFDTGDASDLYTQTAVATTAVTGTDSSGDLNITGVTMNRGNSYTVGYFKGGWPTTSAPTQTTTSAPTQTTLAATSTLTY